MDYNNIIDKAIEAKGNSYSPYSNFAVGAALVTNDDKVYLGTNVENASYGATMCAERSAIFSAISQGEKSSNFKALVIISNMNEYTYPCSLCRQVMTEMFNDKVEIIMTNVKRDYKIVSIDDLVPYKFTREELNDV